MQGLSLKKVGVGILALAVLGIAMFVVVRGREEQLPVEDTQTRSEPTHKVIGTSVEGRAIDAYTYGDGDIHLVFVGGVHGGYEWNSVLLAQKFIYSLNIDNIVVPASLLVTVIPSLNPDGVYAVVGKEGEFTAADAPPEAQTVLGRFNARDVDLNRNFDCKWQPESMWRGNVVSAGTGPFSEPEAAALRDFILQQQPDAVVFWHSQSNAVYASECENGILPETLAIMNVYANASGYPAVSSFNAYEVTGDAEGWLASVGIPALTVELSTHETIEWEKNRAGIMALFSHYSE